jgi:hypothetical protein
MEGGLRDARVLLGSDELCEHLWELGTTAVGEGTLKGPGGERELAEAGVIGGDDAGGRFLGGCGCFDGSGGENEGKGAQLRRQVPAGCGDRRVEDGEGKRSPGSVRILFLIHRRLRLWDAVSNDVGSGLGATEQFSKHHGGPGRGIRVRVVEEDGYERVHAGRSGNGGGSNAGHSAECSEGC